MPSYNAYSYPYFPNAYQQQQQSQQIQDGGFVRVRDIAEAQNWPVAPGNSVTFKVENSPYICTKTMGFSPLEQPRFEKFRLVKEDEPVKEAGDTIRDEIDGIKKRLDALERAGEDTGA